LAYLVTERLKEALEFAGETQSPKLEEQEKDIEETQTSYHIESMGGAVGGTPPMMVFTSGANPIMLGGTASVVTTE
jgi:hypothetical protein